MAEAYELARLQCHVDKDRAALGVHSRGSLRLTRNPAVATIFDGDGGIPYMKSGLPNEALDITAIEGYPMPVPKIPGSFDPELTAATHARYSQLADTYRQLTLSPAP